MRSEGILSSVEKNFNRLWNSLSESGAKTNFSAEEIELFRDREILTALDLGSGQGDNLIYLASNGINCTGVEISQSGIDATLKKAKNMHVRIIKGDIFSKLPFKDGTFDLVLAYQSLNHNIKDKILSAFGEVKRVLKKGGIFSIRIANRETFRLKRIQDNIFLDEDYHVKFQMLDDQTFKGLSGDEEGIIIYAFYENELKSDLTRIGFTKLSSRKTRFHIIANYVT